MSDGKWEYALDEFDLRDVGQVSIEAHMQHRGDDGWELVSYAAINEGLGYTRYVHAAWRRSVNAAPAATAIVCNPVDIALGKLRAERDEAAKSLASSGDRRDWDGSNRDGERLAAIELAISALERAKAGAL